MSSAHTLSESASSDHPVAAYRRGLLCAIAAFGCWGLFPLYWRLLSNVPSIELVCHRIVWSFVFLAMMLSAKWWRARSVGRDGTSCAPSQPGRTRRIGLIYSAAAVLISINWLTFIWAVNHGRVLEASLGYYINPLLSVLLGVIYMSEQLTRWQWTAIVVAALGVVTMASTGDEIPWVALALASSFAVYGLLKKAAPLSSLNGLFIETAVLLLPAIAYVGYCESGPSGVFGRADLQTVLLLMLGGCITVLPLALFATAAQIVPMSMMGILQYIGPTLQFTLGVLMFGEPLGINRAAGFVLVWIGSGIFLLTAGQSPPSATPSSKDQPLAGEVI